MLWPANKSDRMVGGLAICSLLHDSVSFVWGVAAMQSIFSIQVNAHLTKTHNTVQLMRRTLHGSGFAASCLE